MGAVALVGILAGGMALAEVVDQGSVVRGAKLYDKWYKVIHVEAPTVSHKLYPASNAKIAADPAGNWRCKECHGWDGKGADGAYATGGHASGIKGINGMAGGDPAAVVAVLKSEGHGFADKLSDENMNDLANFVVYGQIDYSVFLDGKTALGDAEKGKQVYNTTCINCHGADGKLPKEMPPLGSLVGNPWEVLHKIMNGAPNEAMPGLRAFDHQIGVDVLAFLATLPAE